MRYLVTTELETPFLLKVRRFFGLAKPRVDFFWELISIWRPGEIYYDWDKGRVKIIKQAKQRLVWNNKQ